MFIELKKRYKGERIDTPTAINTARLTWVDHARGIAIMLVVYRHVIVGMRRAGIQVSSLMYNIQEVLYNFRMPVFFVLSGIFLSASLQKKSSADVLKARVSNILYPYLIWASITVILQIFFSNYTNEKRSWSDLYIIIAQPRGVDHLWYLLALFNTNVLYLLLNKIIKKTWIHALIAMILCFLSKTSLLQGNSFWGDTFYFYIYLFVGAKISSILLDKEKREKILKFSNLIWLLPVVLAGQWFWFFFWQKENYLEIERYYLFIFLFINLFACYFVYIISYRISQYNGSAWLAYLGKHSLYIYILHIFIASFIRNIIIYSGLEINPWIIAFVCWSCGLIIPVVLYQGLKSIGFDRMFTLTK